MSIQIEERLKVNDMALTRDFKDTVAARVQTDPAFAQALLDEAMEIVKAPNAQSLKAMAEAQEIITDRQMRFKLAAELRSLAGKRLKNTAPLK